MSSHGLRIHFVSIGKDQKVHDRVTELSKDYQYNWAAVESIQEFLNRWSDFEDSPFLLLNSKGITDDKAFFQSISELRKQSRECFILVVLPPESRLDLTELKKSGAHLVISEKDVFHSSNLEYISSQIIRASYVPIKVAEIERDVILDFTLYHLLPLNQKMLPILPKGTPFSEQRIKKLEGVAEVFVRRDELDVYRAYMNGLQDKSASSLKGKARAQFLSFCSGHSQLMFMLVDKAEQESPRESKWLYDRCEILSKDLLRSLSGLTEAWDVLNNSSLGEFGSVERSPTIAAYAGLLSLLSSIGEPLDVMMAGLLADVGMLSLDPQITKKLKNSLDFSQLTPEELKQYQNHPLLSLKRCEERGIALSRDIEKIILNTHEKINQTGFPHQPPADQIPYEAKLIHFCELIDRAAVIRAGTARLPIDDIRKQILTQEMTKLDTFNYGFLEKIKPVL